MENHNDGSNDIHTYQIIIRDDKGNITINETKELSSRELFNLALSFPNAEITKIS